MKKGFTLVELIAVIIVLGIIALLTTPIITGIIDDSTKSTESASAKNYVVTLDKSLIEGILDRPRTGDYEINISELSDWAKENVTGDLPLSGKVLISNNTVESAQLQMEKFQIICYKNECEAREDFGDYAYYTGDRFNVKNALRASLKRPDEGMPYIRYNVLNKETGELGTAKACIFLKNKELCLDFDYEQAKNEMISYFTEVVGLQKATSTNYASFAPDAMYFVEDVYNMGSCTANNDNSIFGCELSSAQFARDFYSDGLQVSTIVALNQISGVYIQDTDRNERSCSIAKKSYLASNNFEGIEDITDEYIYFCR